MKPIKVLLTDDHQIILDGLQSLLKYTDEITVIAEANNGHEALRVLELYQPDVVLMDIDMPVMNGIEALKEIRLRFPLVKVIILSMHCETGMVKSLMNLGAQGYLLKSCSQEELFSAIRKVATGQSYFSPDVTLSLLRSKSGELATKEDLSGVLTDRELEILKLIVAGFSNREVGEKLFISHRTVDTHRTNVMKKLNVSNIAGLISLAIKNRIV